MTRRFSLHAAGILLLLGATAACCAAESQTVEPMPNQKPAGLNKYVGIYHVLYTDLPADEAKQALIRLTAMIEMYRQLTPERSIPKQSKWPVYLYSRFEDYRRSLGEGERPSAGRYDGLILRAVMDGETFWLPGVWRIIQHEGWHQYSHRVLQQGSPPSLWLEEGLAEYFGAAVWKDGKFHPGHIDAGTFVQRDKTIALQPGRLQRVQARIQTGQFRPLESLVTMKLADWPKQTSASNHDQVWSLVHFLLHAGKSKYRKALQAYLTEVLRNPPKGSKRLEVFRTHFGRDLHQLQKEYETWWLAQPTPRVGGLLVPKIPS